LCKKSHQSLQSNNSKLEEVHSNDNQQIKTGITSVHSMKKRHRQQSLHDNENGNEPPDNGQPFIGAAGTNLLNNNLLASLKEAFARPEGDYW
jgi:hypothetical protein